MFRFQALIGIGCVKKRADLRENLRRLLPVLFHSPAIGIDSRPAMRKDRGENIRATGASLRKAAV